MTTDPTSSIEQSAAAARAAALARDTIGHVWGTTLLQPWNARREIFFQALESSAAASNDLVEEAANSLDQLEVIEKKIEALLTKHDAADPEVSASIAIPDRDTLINWHRFLASAARVLWLAHHPAEDWNPLRATPDLWRQRIEEWADDHIAPEDIRAAVRLAHLLRTEHRQFVTMPRPEKRQTGATSGN